MQYRNFGKLGIKGSAFGLGCMRFNGAASGDSTIDEEKAISLIAPVRCWGVIRVLPIIPSVRERGLELQQATESL